MQTYILEPLSTDDAAAIRAKGGHRYIADEKPGFPCRACLRDAEIGDELLLVSHDPFDTDSPYRSASPIFVHAQDCRGTIKTERAGSRLPEQLTVRQLAVRAFDDQAMMIDAVVIDGEALDEVIDAMLADPGADHLQVHFAQRGCWAVRVARR